MVNIMTENWMACCYVKFEKCSAYRDHNIFGGDCFESANFKLFENDLENRLSVWIWDRGREFAPDNLLIILSFLNFVGLS